MTELAGAATTQRPGNKIGSIGYVMKNVQLKIINVDTGKTLGPNEVGELLWKSPYIMTEYYNNPQATKRAIDADGNLSLLFLRVNFIRAEFTFDYVSSGWLHSGDMGYYEEDGKIYICDRIVNTVRIRGYMVYPTEIENVLYSHPAVSEVAVVTIHDNIEERPIAFVAKVPDAEVRN